MSSFEKPSFSATAHETAASKPSHDAGSSFSTHGEKAGSPVAMVSLPAATVCRAPSVAGAEPASDPVGAKAQAVR